MKRTLLALLLVGCAPAMQWVKPGGSQAEYQQDGARCQYEAAAATATYGSSAPVPYSTGAAFGQGIGIGIGRSMESNNLIVLCMRAKGYSQVPMGSAPPMMAGPLPAPTAAAPPPPIAPTVSGMKAESKYMLLAEAMAKAEGCVPPNTYLTAKGAGSESFIASCPNGSTVTMSCDASGCRVLR